MTTALVIGSIKTPGVRGLSTEVAERAEDLSIAEELTNAAFDSNGRMCARKGWTDLVEGGATHTDDIVSVHEYVVDDEDKYIIHKAADKFYRGTTTLVDITGGLEPQVGGFLFVNFNGKCLAFKESDTPVVATGTGNFANIVASAGTLPDGGVAISAWGRVWVTDTNNSKVKWSGLLDETNWSTGGSGEIDLTEVWPDGLDYVVGLAELQNKLVIFGQRSTLIYDGAAETPASSLALVDTVRVGCIAHRSIALVANDLVFLAVDGLHSLQRAIEFSNLPQEPLALGVRSDLVEDILTVLDSPETIHCAYDRHEGFYIARLNNQYWFFDLKQGVARPSKWKGIGFLSITEGTDGRLYMGQPGGALGEYTGYTDDGSSYQFRYKSAWLDLAQGREIFPKTAKVVLVSTGDYTVSMTTGYDYDLSEQVTQYTMDTARTVSEWQPANVEVTINPTLHEWGTAEWSGGTSNIVTAPFDLSGAGSRLQVGIRVSINGYSLCIQRIDITSRLGRIAA